MPEIEELANTCTAAIRSAFEKYTSARNPAWFVGEFIDAKGVSSSQNGVYGVSAWLALSGLFRCENDRLGASCTKFLLDAVGRAHKDQETEKEAPPHELRYVLPKMCAAYWGLCSEPATKNGAEQVASAREQVLNWILDSRDPTAGGWPFVYQDEISNPEPVATALVVRTLHNHGTLDINIRRSAEEYLWRTWRHMANPYWRLYILNTLGRESRFAVGRAIRDTIRRLLRQLRRNPTSVAHPVNIDFVDDRQSPVRLRFFRVPADVVLLESMYHLSPDELDFLRYGPGRALLRSLERVFVGQAVPEKDTCGNQLTFSTCLDTVSLLRRLTARPMIEPTEMLVVKVFRVRPDRTEEPNPVEVLQPFSIYADDWIRLKRVKGLIMIFWTFYRMALFFAFMASLSLGLLVWLRHSDIAGEARGLFFAFVVALIVEWASTLRIREMDLE